MKKILLILAFIFYSGANVWGQITTTGTGNWSSTTPDAPWPSGIIPTSTDNVIIAHAVVVDDGSAMCQDLSFTTGSISFNSASSVLSIYGNSTFGSGITNITSWTSGAKLVFAGTATQTLTTGTTTRFDAIEVNKASGTVTQATGAIIRIGSSLTVTSGTFTLGSGTDIEGFQFTDGTTATTPSITVAVGATLNINSGATYIRSGSVNFTKIGAVTIYGTANFATTSGNGLNFGAVTVGNGIDAANVYMTSSFGASGLFSFLSLTVLNNSTFTMNASSIAASTFGTLSGTGTVVYGTTGTSSNLPTLDQNWPGNLTISCTRSVALTANRSITGNLNVTGTAIFQVGGAQLTIGGDLTVNEGAQIGCSNNSGTIVAAASGTQTFTLNGFCRVSSNASQSPNPTSGFLRQFAFDAYVFGANSIVSFRNPTTTASTTIVVNIDGPASTPFANVEFYDVQTVATTTCQFLLRQNISVIGSISFPRIASGQPTTLTLNGYTLKVGKQIINSLGTLGLNTGNTNSAGGTRTFTMNGTIELNGSSAQNTLGGTDLPATFNNLTINNSAGVTLANNITVDGTLSLLAGVFNKNGKTLTLNGTISTSGTGGIGESQALNAPSSVDVGGLGALITSGADLGNTTVTRGYNAHTANGSQTIKRWYNITPTTNTGLNATLVFPYSEGDELNGISESDLRLFKSTDNGTTWTMAGGTVDAGNNQVTLTGIDGFSLWTLGDVNSPLPIELSSINILKNGNSVNFSWTTKTEVNSHQFLVERKANNNWEVIGEVKASGNSNSVKEYSFTDKYLVAGKYSYRLKMVDNDGSFEYSKEAEVEIELPNEFNLSQNYPNPFNPSTIISYQLPSDSKVVLELFAVTGEKIATLVNDVQSAGQYNYPLSITDYQLSSGTYIYRLVAGDFVSVKKMVVLK